ncbi:sigma-70 family RNA polymerase sigma factor [Rhizomicrobium electricum]|uniref:RNA polymerase sigma factor n=2 Tax=Rhizomicrobium electricum TaxID=480070 RepID=A0ABN1F7L9_9PROT
MGQGMGLDRDAIRPDWAVLIVAVSARGDRAAFAELFAFFAPRIKSFMLRSGESEVQAEELAQEAMLMVWRKAALFDPAGASASAWIFTIARNLRIDAKRRTRRESALVAGDVDDEFHIDEAPLPDARLAETQTEANVRNALAQLPPDQLRVVEMSFFQDRPHAEIADALKIPLGTVKSRLRLAMRRLRSLLGEET